MKAVLYDSHGGAEVLRCTEVADPEPGPGDVVVQVAATALNRLDIVQRAGYFTMPGFALPHIAGMDVAATMAACTTRGTAFTYEQMSTWLREAGFTAIRLIEPIAAQQLFVATKGSYNGE